MKRLKKILIWIIAVTGAFVIVLVIGNLMAPRLINSERVRERIEAGISESTGGEVLFGSLELALLPMPRVTAGEVSLKVPGTAEGTAESLSAYIKVLPLLRGKVRLAKLRVLAPELNVTLPGEERLGAAAHGRPDIEGAFAAMAGVVKGLARRSGPVVIIEDGRFAFNGPDEAGGLTLTGVDLMAALRPDRLAVSLRCASKLWDGLDLDAGFDTASMEGTVRAGVTGLKTGPLAGRVHPGIASRVRDAAVDLDIDLTVEGAGALTAEVRGSWPGLMLTGPGGAGGAGGAGGGGGDFSMGSGEFKGSARLDNRMVEARLTELNLKVPRARVTGSLAFDRDSGNITLEIIGSDVDLEASREAALATAGDIPLVEKTFRVLKGGRVAKVTYRVAGPAKALRDARGYGLKARIEEAHVTIPRAGDIRDVRGAVEITRGVLEGNGLEGRLGGILGRSSKLRYTLYGKDTPVSLATVVDADLRGLPEVLGRIVRNEAFSGELRRFDVTGGRAQGRFFLDGTKKSLSARAEIRDLSVGASYDRIPYPISIKRGGFSYNKDRVEATGLEGSVGESAFTGLTLRATLAGVPTLAIDTLHASVLTQEAYAMVSSLGLMKKARERIASTGGRVTIDGLVLKGPLRRPKEWGFEALGKIEDIKAEVALVPGPLTLSGGSFTADRERVSITGVRAGFLDGDIRLTAALSPYLDAAPSSVEVDFDGALGPDAALWAQETARVPLELRLRPPLSITGGVVSWQGRLEKGGGGLTLAGRFSAGQGAVLDLDLKKTTGLLDIKKLSIRDRKKEETLTLTLSIGHGTLNSEWKGRLTGETLSRLLFKNTLLDGWVEGDFGVALRPDERPPFKATGVLAGGGGGGGGGINVPAAFFGGLKVEGFSVEGDGEVLRVGSTEMTWMERPIRVRGEITSSAEGGGGGGGGGVYLDMDASAGELRWDELKNAIMGKGRDEAAPIEGAGGAGGAGLRAPRASGKIRLETERFAFKGFIWSGVAAEVAFSPGRTLVTVTEGEVCGVSTPGHIKATEGMVELSFSPVAERRDLDSSIGCISGMDRLATGLLDVTGALTSKGTPAELMKNATGRFALSAENGRIHRFGVVGKVFALLNVTELFKGKFPGLAEEGFSYRSMKASLELEEGRLRLAEGMMDSASMEMAAAGEIDLLNRNLEIKLLAAPLKSVDYVVKKLPVMGEILGGALVTIPMRVSGTFDDPKVTYLSPKDIGSRVFEIMKRTLKAPVRIIEPMIPGRKEK